MPETNVRVCSRCHEPVHHSSLEDYAWYCDDCGEDLYGTETHLREFQRYTITVELTIDPWRHSKEEIQGTLAEVAPFCMGEGYYTSDLAATIEDWSHSVTPGLSSAPTVHLSPQWAVAELERRVILRQKEYEDCVGTQVPLAEVEPWDDQEDTPYYTGMAQACGIILERDIPSIRVELTIDDD